MNEANGTLLAHARDLLSRAERGEVTATAFLTPLEQKQLERELSFARERFCFRGGYAEAERRRMVFLPDYWEEFSPDVREEALLSFEGEECLPFLIKGSGYRELSHRDFLGAALHLGIKRETIGDICPVPPHGAILFCDRRMGAFLKEHLTRVASDAVTVSETELAPEFDGGRTYERITDTVASPRADAVVAALLHLSREKAQALFLRELVEVDYSTVTKHEKEIEEGAVLTVRGHGKFKIRALHEKTKKGRIRLVADRYL